MCTRGGTGKCAPWRRRPKIFVFSGVETRGFFVGRSEARTPLARLYPHLHADECTYSVYTTHGEYVHVLWSHRYKRGRRLFFQFPTCTVKIFTAVFEQPDNRCSNSYQSPFYTQLNFLPILNTLQSLRRLSQAENRVQKGSHNQYLQENTAI